MLTLSERAKTAVRQAFALDPEIKLLSNWHALTFACMRRAGAGICRVTPASHRSLDAIEAELEWQHFVIAEGGIDAPRALKSVAGRLWELVEDKGTLFTAVLFEKLTGRPILAENWNESLFMAWGALVGRLHSVSRSFQPKWRSAPWYASDFLNVNAYIPESLEEVRLASQQIIAEVRRLPEDPAHFGMIHGDVYQDNLLLGSAGLQLFDFDNCEFGFYVSDIAVSLYAALWRQEEDGTETDFARRFLNAFLTGYLREFSLPQAQLEKLPLFLRLREVLIYNVGWKMVDPKKMSPAAKLRAESRRRRIVDGQPIVAVT